jgi:hypothetical protein
MVLGGDFIARDGNREVPDVSGLGPDGTRVVTCRGGVHLVSSNRSCIQGGKRPTKIGNEIVDDIQTMKTGPRAELRAFTDAQAWLRVFRLPAYAPDPNPVEGIWPVLKGGVLADLASHHRQSELPQTCPSAATRHPRPAVVAARVLRHGSGITVRVTLP